MRKKLFFVFLFCFAIMGIFVVSASANPDGPVILSPTQYQEIPAATSLTIRWSAPPSGTVSEYYVRIRELSVGKVISNSLIYDCSIYNPNITSRVLDTSYIRPGGMYRLSVSALLTNGSIKWSDEYYFFGSYSRGVNINNTISFKIYTGFDYETKEAIYYGARRWSNQLGIEVVNTYAYNLGVSFTEINNNDGINTVIPYTNTATDALMSTHIRWNNNYHIVEADIVINKAFPWSNEIQNGKYYIPNVITHEMGHAVGLTDKYNALTTEWTMYGYSEPADSKKVTLHSADIATLNSFYGIS